MQEDTPERPPMGNLVEALQVRRNATLGFGVGVLVAALLYVYRVELIGSVRGQAGGPLTFLMLGFVLAFALGALVTALLTAVTVARLARDAD